MQLSFRPELPSFAEVSISRYADPEADGVTPVLRSNSGVRRVDYSPRKTGRTYRVCATRLATEISQALQSSDCLEPHQT